MASPFEILYGTEQGRIVPASHAPTDGTYSYVLGADTGLPEHLTGIAVGDYVEISQLADFDTIQIVSLDVSALGPTLLVSGSSGWRLSLRIDGTERVGRSFVAEQDFVTVLSANVSALVGNHTLALRLEVLA